MKVVIVCLNEKFVAGTGKALGASLGVKCACCSEEISSSLAELHTPLFEFSKEWLERHERQVVKECCKSDIVAADYNLFSRHRAHMKGDIIYLRLEKDRVDKIYKSRFATVDLRIKGIAKSVISCETTQEAAEKITKVIGEWR